jgi:hypothetical protein
MFCGEQMAQPLTVENRLYMFCCLKHKLAWDAGSREVQRLAETEDILSYGHNR